MEYKQDSENNNKENNDSLSVYCQCGQKLEANWKFCPKCKTPIKIEIKSTTHSEKNKFMRKDNAFIYIALFAIIAIASYFLNFDFGFAPLLIILITGKINCPNSITIKVLFWSTILFIILYFIFMVFAFLTFLSCLEFCSTLD